MLRIVFRGSALGYLTLALLGCVQPPALMIETSSGDLVPLDSWTGTLSARSGEMRGMATLAPGATYRETEATLILSGAAPSTVHAWYVQLGECGYDRGILVGPQAYTPIAVDAHGEGRSIVLLPFTVPSNGQFFVTVRQSESEASPVIACGNLTKVRPAHSATVAEARGP